MATCTTTRTFYRGTIEHLDIAVEADVTLKGAVDISFDRETWYPADWLGAEGFERTLRVLIDSTSDDPAPPAVPLPYGKAAQVYVRLTSFPETPILLAGSFSIR